MSAINLRKNYKVNKMNIEKFQAAIKGQKTIIISHRKVQWGIVSRTIEVSDIRILPNANLVEYTFYTHLNDSEHLGNCADVLIRVTDIVEVRSVCSLEEWNTPPVIG